MCCKTAVIIVPLCLYISIIELNSRISLLLRLCFVLVFSKVVGVFSFTSRDEMVCGMKLSQSRCLRATQINVGSKFKTEAVLFPKRSTVQEKVLATRDGGDDSKSLFQLRSPSQFHLQL